MNDSERRDWIENDEGLYEMWKASRMSISKFVRMYRNELDNLPMELSEEDNQVSETEVVFCVSCGSGVKRSDKVCRWCGVSYPASIW